MKRNKINLGEEFKALVFPFDLDLKQTDEEGKFIPQNWSNVVFFDENNELVGIFSINFGIYGILYCFFKKGTIKKVQTINGPSFEFTYIDRDGYNVRIEGFERIHDDAISDKAKTLSERILKEFTINDILDLLRGTKFSEKRIPWVKSIISVLEEVKIFSFQIKIEFEERKTA